MAHAGRGGLQQHSVGGNYPFILVGVQKFIGTHDQFTAPLQWQVMHAATGNVSKLFRTQHEAQMHINSLRIHNMMHS